MRSGGRSATICAVYNPCALSTKKKGNDALTVMHPPRRIPLGPGPSDVPNRVLNALARPTTGHPDPGFLAILNDTLDPGPYLLGESFSAVDVYLWMLTSWHPDPPRMLQRNPRVRLLAERVLARPAVARIWPEHEDG